MERSMKNIKYEGDLNLTATELRLGLPGSDEADEKEKQPSIPTVRSGNKRNSSEISEESSLIKPENGAPPAKAQVVGWPPIRSYRKNCLQSNNKKINEGDGVATLVKVSVDGAPYLRKIDVRVYRSYPELLKALENMFKLTIGAYSGREGYHGSDFAPTYEDKDGDWMLVGDVPWEMFIASCKRLRIMKGSEARGLASV